VVAQTGQGVVIVAPSRGMSLRMSLRGGASVGFRSSMVRRIVPVSSGEGDRGELVGFGADGVAGRRFQVRASHAASVAGVVESAAAAGLSGAVAGGFGVALALAVVRVNSWAVRAWILRWIAAGFSVG
jgi:hypothetical protein